MFCEIDQNDMIDHRKNFTGQICLGLSGERPPIRQRQGVIQKNDRIASRRISPRRFSQEARAFSR